MIIISFNRKFLQEYLFNNTYKRKQAQDEYQQIEINLLILKEILLIVQSFTKSHATLFHFLVHLKKRQFLETDNGSVLNIFARTSVRITQIIHVSKSTNKRIYVIWRSTNNRFCANFFDIIHRRIFAGGPEPKENFGTNIATVNLILFRSYVYFSLKVKKKIILICKKQE